MIAEALRVLLFGMLGIFFVMAIIYGVIVALQSLSGKAERRAESASDTVAETLADDSMVVEPVEHQEVYEYPSDGVEYDGVGYDGVEYLVEGEDYYFPDEAVEYVMEPEVEVV